MSPRYTVQRVRKDNSFYGTIHGSDDADLTYCGKEIDWRWYILNNRGTGEVTCKHCKWRTEDEDDD